MHYINQKVYIVEIGGFHFLVPICLKKSPPDWKVDKEKRAQENENRQFQLYKLFGLCSALEFIKVPLKFCFENKRTFYTIKMININFLIVIQKMMSDRLSKTKETVKKHYVLIICFCIAFILRLFVAAIGGIRHWDFRDLTATGLLLVEGKVPYRDIPIGQTDYPPLIAYTMMVTIFLCGDVVFLYKLPFIICDIAIGFVLYVFTKEWHIGDESSSLRIYTITLFYLFLPYPIFESSYIGRFDSIPTLFLLLSIYFLQKEHYNRAGLCWGIGVMYKWFPVIIAPVLFLYFFKSHKLKKFTKFLLITVLTCFLISLPFLVIAPIQYVSKMLYHLTGRAVSTDLAVYSLYSYLTTDYSITVRIVSTIIQVAVLLGVIWKFSVARNLFETPFVLIIFSGLFLNAFVLFNRIINPQYFFWYAPILLFLLFRQKIAKRQLFLIAFFIINLDVIAFAQFFMQWGYRDSILTIPLPFESMILYVVVFHAFSHILFVYLLNFYTSNRPSVPSKSINNG
jgi:Gpi18-like mannosyltransferase